MKILCLDAKGIATFSYKKSERVLSTKKTITLSSPPFNTNTNQISIKKDITAEIPRYDNTRVQHETRT